MNQRIRGLLTGAALCVSGANASAGLAGSLMLRYRHRLEKSRLRGQRTCLSSSLGVLIALVGAGFVAAGPADALPVPAGDRVVVRISTSTANGCAAVVDPAGFAICAEQASPTATAAIAPTTFPFGSGTFLTAGVAVDSASKMTASVFTTGTRGEVFAAMNDSYTVGGTALGPVLITANFHVTGTFGTVPTFLGNLLAFEDLSLSIGTFHPESTTEQFLVQAFAPDANNAGLANSFQTHSSINPSPVATTLPVDLTVSYKKMVSVGDRFDLAYAMSGEVHFGQMDLTHTGTISFDLPANVVLTSALGGTFGVSPVPEPDAYVLFGIGLAGLGFTLRKRAA